MTDTAREHAGPTSGAAGSGPGTVGPPASRPVRARHRLRLFVVGAVLVGAVAFLLAEGIGNSLDYFDTVGQAFAHKSALGSSPLRLEGTVVHGTVHPTAAGTDFSVSGDGHTVAVVATGTPPQLFQAGVPVVVVGHFVSAASDTFVSDQILVKHSSTYIAAHPGRVRAPDGSVR